MHVGDGVAHCERFDHRIQEGLPHLADSSYFWVTSMASLWASGKWLPSGGVRNAVLKLSTENEYRRLVGRAPRGDPGRHLGPRVEAQLVADVFDVALGRPLGQVKAAGNGTVRKALGDQSRPLELAA